jgi:hypothetical protein
VAGDGTWTLTVSLAVGTHALKATQATPAGATSAFGPATSVTVYAPPPAPTLSAPAASGRSVAVNGTGVAGNTISIYDGTVLVGSALVGGDGKWSTVVSLAVGTHSLKATQTHPVSGATGAASAPSSVTVYDAPAAPAIASATTTNPGRWWSTVSVSGTGVAGAQVTLYDGDDAVGTVTVGAGGTWTLSVTLWVGTRTLTATQTLAGLTSPASAAYTAVVRSR